MNAPAKSAGIEINNLRVRYGAFVAVEDTSLNVAPGESFGIVGESGSGKSTILRAICGLAPIERGRVQLTRAPDTATTEPLPAPGSKAFRRQVQMVFQDPYGSLHHAKPWIGFWPSRLRFTLLAMPSCGSPARWTT